MNNSLSAREKQRFRALKVGDTIDIILSSPFSLTAEHIPEETLIASDQNIFSGPAGSQQSETESINNQRFPRVRYKNYLHKWKQNLVLERIKDFEFSNLMKFSRQTRIRSHSLDPIIEEPHRYPYKLESRLREEKRKVLGQEIYQIGQANIEMEFLLNRIGKIYLASPPEHQVQLRALSEIILEFQRNDIVSLKKGSYRSIANEINRLTAIDGKTPQQSLDSSEDPTPSTQNNENQINQGGQSIEIETRTKQETKETDTDKRKSLNIKQKNKYCLNFSIFRKLISKAHSILAKIRNISLFFTFYAKNKLDSDSQIESILGSFLDSKSINHIQKVTKKLKQVINQKSDFESVQFFKTKLSIDLLLFENNPSSHVQWDLSYKEYQEWKFQKWKSEVAVCRICERKIIPSKLSEHSADCFELLNLADKLTKLRKDLDLLGRSALAEKNSVNVQTVIKKKTLEKKMTTQFTPDDENKEESQPPPGSDEDDPIAMAMKKFQKKPSQFLEVPQPDPEELIKTENIMPPRKGFLMKKPATDFSTEEIKVEKKHEELNSSNTLSTQESVDKPEPPSNPAKRGFLMKKPAMTFEPETKDENIIEPKTEEPNPSITTVGVPENSSKSEPPTNPAKRGFLTKKPAMTFEPEEKDDNNLEKNIEELKPSFTMSAPENVSNEPQTNLAKRGFLTKKPAIVFSPEEEKIEVNSEKKPEEIDNNLDNRFPNIPQASEDKPLISLTPVTNGPVRSTSAALEDEEDPIEKAQKNFIARKFNSYASDNGKVDFDSFDSANRSTFKNADKKFSFLNTDQSDQSSGDQDSMNSSQSRVTPNREAPAWPSVEETKPNDSFSTADSEDNKRLNQEPPKKSLFGREATIKSKMNLLKSFEGEGTPNRPPLTLNTTVDDSAIPKIIVSPAKEGPTKNDENLEIKVPTEPPKMLAKKKGMLVRSNTTSIEQVEGSLISKPKLSRFTPISKQEIKKSQEEQKKLSERAKILELIVHFGIKLMDEHASARRKITLDAEKEIEEMAGVQNLKPKVNDLRKSEASLDEEPQEPHYQIVRDFLALLEVQKEIDSKIIAIEKRIEKTLVQANSVEGGAIGAKKAFAKRVLSDSFKAPSNKASLLKGTKLNLKSKFIERSATESPNLTLKEEGQENCKGLEGVSLMDKFKVRNLRSKTMELKQENEVTPKGNVGTNEAKKVIENNQEDTSPVENVSPTDLVKNKLKELRRSSPTKVSRLDSSSIKTIVEVKDDGGSLQSLDTPIRLPEEKKPKADSNHSIDEILCGEESPNGKKNVPSLENLDKPDKSGPFDDVIPTRSQYRSKSSAPASQTDLGEKVLAGGIVIKPVKRIQELRAENAFNLLSPQCKPRVGLTKISKSHLISDVLMSPNHNHNFKNKPKGRKTPDHVGLSHFKPRVSTTDVEKPSNNNFESSPEKERVRPPISIQIAPKLQRSKIIELRPADGRPIGQRGRKESMHSDDEDDSAKKGTKPIKLMHHKDFKDSPQKKPTLEEKKFAEDEMENKNSEEDSPYKSPDEQKLGSPLIRGYMSDGAIKKRSETFNPKDWIIPQVSINDFEFIKMISKGAFGRVWLVKKKATRDLYAMKIIDSQNKMEMSQLQSIMAERNVFSMLEGEYVVKAIWTFRYHSYLCFVMEYMIGGDFGYILESYTCLDEFVAKFYLAEVVLALESMHKKKIIHRDLKPDNILLDAKGHIKLTDFGLSEAAVKKKTKANPEMSSPANDFHKRYDRDEQMRKLLSTTNDSNFFDERSFNLSKRNARVHEDLNSAKIAKAEEQKRHRIVGTPDYIAPEIIEGLEHDESVDWWSLGVMTYEFICGCPPFNADNTEAIFDNIMNLRIIWPEIGDGDDCMSHACKDFIERLLVLDPKKRMKVDEIKAHPFFKGIDWKNLRTKTAPIIPKYKSNIDLANFQKESKVLSEKEKANPFFEQDGKTPASPVIQNNELMSQFDLARIDLLHKLNEEDAEKLKKLRNRRSKFAEDYELQFV